MNTRSITAALACAMLTAAGLACNHTQSSAATTSSASAAQGADPSTSASNTSASNGSNAAAMRDVPLPAGASLVATTRESDVRAVPAHQKAGNAEIVGEAVGVGGVERVYQAPLSYKDAVAFYDHALANAPAVARDGGSAHRTRAADMTSWSFRTPSGDPARVAVRDTQPTTIEVMALTEEAAALEEVPAGRGNAPSGGQAAQAPGRTNAQPGADTMQPAGRTNAQPGGDTTPSNARDAGRR